ncbi:Tetraspanin/Peripherin [Trinorchestia longiramus]|nr:Tetraspanin/Peripherin [Trinorchestia longiramus]
MSREKVSLWLGLCGTGSISGVVIIIIGAVIESIYRNYLNFLTPKLSFVSPTMVLIGVGVVIFVVGFFGCCGAAKESRCMVMTFAVLVVLIFIVQVSAGIAAYVRRADVKDLLKENLLASMNNYNESNASIYKTWNIIQHDYMCCGTDSYEDWIATSYGEVYDGVPDDCCKESVRNCGHGIFNHPEQLNTIYKDGCFDKLEGDLLENVTILGSIAIGIGFVQLVGVAFACCLGRSLKRQYETV